MISIKAIPSELYLQSLGSSGDKRWYTAAMQCEHGNYQGAAATICEMLRENNGRNQAVDILTSKANDSDHKINEAMKASDYQETIDLISGDMFSVLVRILISNIDLQAITNNNDYTGNVLTMAELIAGYGMAEVAYNAGNSLQAKAKNQDDFKISEKLYLMVIKGTQNDALKAAALVNYGEIVRDGKVTGVPDYKKAIELYSQAGELGQITGMHNAATVSTWLMEDGHQEEFAPIAEYWLKRLLDRVESPEPLLETDRHANLNRLIDGAKTMMARLQVEKQVTNPDMDYAIRLCRSIKEQNATTHWIIDRAYINKISAMEKPMHKGCAHNWAYVLGALDWNILGVHQVNAHYGLLGVALPDEKQPHIDMVVVNTTIFKDLNGNVHPDCIELIGELKKTHRLPFLVAPSLACFTTVDGRVYTPILVVSNKGTWPISISAGVTPEILRNLVNNPIPFINDITFSHSCVISIAINKLALNRSISDKFTLGEMWSANTENWKIPMGPDLAGMKA